MIRKISSAGLALSVLWVVISLAVKGGLGVSWATGLATNATNTTCFFDNLPCGSGDPAQSLCNLSAPPNTTGTGTCRAYRTTVANVCGKPNNNLNLIGAIIVTLDGNASETWVCTVQANLRITQGDTAGNWEFSTDTRDLPPSGLGLKEGSFGGSFGPLQIGANASDLRQISGNAWGPQLGPFHGGDTVTFAVFGDDDQPAVFDRVNINAMCCQGF